MSLFVLPCNAFANAATMSSPPAMFPSISASTCIPSHSGECSPMYPCCHLCKLHLAILSSHQHKRRCCPRDRGLVICRSHLKHIHCLIAASAGINHLFDSVGWYFILNVAVVVSNRVSTIFVHFRDFTRIPVPMPTCHNPPRTQPASLHRTSCP